VTDFDEDMDEAEVMACYPALPDDADFASAALWAATILMHASIDRGWNRSELRHTLLTLAAVPCAAHATDEQLHQELQGILDAIRSNRATKQ